MPQKIKRTAQNQTVTIYTDGFPVSVYIENENSTKEIWLSGQEEAEGLLWALQAALDDLKKQEDKL